VDPIHWAVVNAVKELYTKLSAAIADLSILKSNDAAADREIASIKAKNQKLEHENAEMKARLDKIEKMLKSK
jgi:cell division protein FtsB